MNASFRVSIVCLALLISPFLVVTVGCSSKSDNSGASPTKVSPPSLSQRVDDPVDPPGTMELPSEMGDGNIAGEISGQAKSDPSSPESDGILMPNVAETPSIQPQYATWEELIAAATSTGKITVVDVWSLVCEPCVKEFPGLVRLHNAMGDSVDCMSISIDYDGRKSKPPESYEPRVTKFLTAKGADFANFISRTPDEDIYSDAGIDSIPAVLVFDAQGQLVKKYVDVGDGVGFTYDKDIIPFVKSLIR